LETRALTLQNESLPPQPPAIRVLIADDEPELRRSIARMLSSHGLQVVTAEDGVNALQVLETEAVDVALVDLMMPRLSGFELLAKMRARFPDIEVVMMTAFGDVETAVRAVQAGAYNFLTKPFRSNDEVELIIRQAAERRMLKAHAEQLERRLLASRVGLGGMIGSSPIMQDVYRKAMDVASTKVTVLVLGESGTGKELTARAIHEHSNRNKKAFMAVNCSAIPEGIVESELFGHVKGAFTNATSPRPGLFEAADQGTIFLDEVGDLPPQAQVKLLRVLQEGEVKRVGSNDVRVVDVRVIAATNLDLRRKIENGTFREDLYYRLNVVAVHLPPLRSRREDIPALAYHFLRKHAARVGREVTDISPSAMELLMDQPWPGNVRELENAIERAVVFAKETVVPENLGLGRSSDRYPKIVLPAADPPASSPASSDRPSERSPSERGADRSNSDRGSFEHGLSSERGSSDRPAERNSDRTPIDRTSGERTSGDRTSATDGSSERLLGVVELPDTLPNLSYRDAKEHAVAIFERFYFSALRQRTQANVSEAARQAGLDRSNFRRAVKRAGVAWRIDDDEP
jgi:DNA-binding NtrC family response regulator